MVRVAIFLLLAIVLYKFLANLLKDSRTKRREGPLDGKIADLVRDPHCGTYLLPEQGVSARVGGQVHHFCSEACRDRFLAEQSAKQEKRG